MTTPSNAEKNIRLARWLYPGGAWYADQNGIAVNVLGASFDVNNIRDREKVMMKLFALGIKIHERKRSGRTVWEAVTQDGGSTEHESLEILLWQVVDKILEGGK